MYRLYIAAKEVKEHQEIEHIPLAMSEETCLLLRVDRHCRE